MFISEGIVFILDFFLVRFFLGFGKKVYIFSLYFSLVYNKLVVVIGVKKVFNKVKILII